jgi:mono/diheme cytochrome c family protein
MEFAKQSNLLSFFSVFVGMFLIIQACTHSPEEMAQPIPPNDTLNNPPPVDTLLCDSSNVTYPGTVFPIFQNYCLTCHSGPTPAGGLDFNDYNNVAFIAENGRLLGALRHEPGFSPMPQNQSKLSQCEIALIAKWVNDTTFNGGGGSGNNGIPCDPDTVYFQNDVLPLLMSSCGIIGCHDAQTAQKEVILTSYFHVMQSDVVEPFDPESSDMWEHITEDDPDKRMPPPPAQPLNSQQKDIIYSWIAQGALDNYCDNEDCDTLNVTFSETVFPIIQNNCYGCHSGSNPNGGISLESYSNIVNQASIPPGNPGSLMGAITWAAGNTPMPNNGPQIGGCEIKQIQTWIENGMPDN